MFISIVPVVACGDNSEIGLVPSPKRRLLVVIEVSPVPPFETSIVVAFQTPVVTVPNVVMEV